MKSLILIPSYLWKNTFKRWLENPISPISKILVPFLLGLLASLVLVFFIISEQKLLENLSRTNTYDVYLTEQVSGVMTPVIAKQTFTEEKMWSDKFGADTITFVRQSFATAELRIKNKHATVIVYSDSANDLNQLRDDIQAPTIWLLSSNPSQYGAQEYVTIKEKKLLTTTGKLPANIQKVTNSENVVAMPASMAQAILQGGFITHLLAEFDNISDVEKFNHYTSAFYEAERRLPRTFSAIGILDSLKEMKKAHTLIRIGIVAGCGVILALILGTIAWLEYRQEAYLLALLRSFGTPRIILVAHSFLENLLLVTTGMLLALYGWRPLYELLNKNVEQLDLSSSAPLNLPVGDSSIILIAGAVGVLTAMIPVAIGLRKPAGLILQ